jgi:photosystem II stability/assembly factor-like uncharacterized protein
VSGIRRTMVLWLVVALHLVACDAPTPREGAASPTLLPTSAALLSPSPSPEPPTPAAPPPSTLSESPSPVPTPVTVSPTAAPRTPAPSATAPHAVTDLVPPLIVDSQAGRLYMTGRVDGMQQIVALAAADGSLLATYGLTGTIDVDPTRGWLYVDQNSSGLLVLDAQTGKQRTLIPLPGSQRQDVTYPAPQADPGTGQVLAFRDHLVYVIDPDQGTVVRVIPFDTHKGDDCRTLTEPLPIEWAVYDDPRRLLYLDFVTYVCTPWIGETLVSFDLNTNAQVAQQGVTSGPVSAFDGYLYGSGWYRMGMGYRWAWRDGKPWFESEGWDNSTRLLVDAARGRLYESDSVHGFRAFDLETMSLLFVLPSPVDGDLIGYDPGTDQLYYLREGHLATYPATAIAPPTPEPPQVAVPPAKPVRQLVLSSGGSQAPSLLGLWDYGMTWDACYIFGAKGGLFYLSADGGKVWSQPRGGLGGGCDRISALAVSPDCAADQTIFAALVGNGIFRSSDGGRLWRPASTGLPSMSIEQILLSPGFASDRMAFSRSWVLGQGNLYRSSDGGATWERLGVELGLVAMSPEFDRDGVLMGVSADQVVVSCDRGETWESVGVVPEGDSITRLGLAPRFERWQVVFAFGSASQNLYRSADGGRSWDVVLSVGGHAFGPFPPQLVFGPETEGGRLLFLLATDSDPNADFFKDQGTLYRSEDGGLTWEALMLPPDLVPTALAISPTYAQDGLIWLGTADGRVLALEAALLHGGS